MNNIYMTEQDQKNLKYFIYFILGLILFLFFLVLYVHILYPYYGCGYNYVRTCYQPELSWYSGPIGCGCK
jgi:hypothetical protein